MALCLACDLLDIASWRTLTNGSDDDTWAIGWSARVDLRRLGDRAWVAAVGRVRGCEDSAAPMIALSLAMIGLITILMFVVIFGLND